jgi:hypothetical protein
MKFPVNRKWKTVQKTDIGLDLYATKNITFDNDGIVQVSDRVITLINEDNDADFGVPLAFYNDAYGVTHAATDDEVFAIDISDGSPTATQEAPAFGDTPNPSATNSSAVFFNNEWVLTQATNICTFSANAVSPWTARTLSPALTTGKKHHIAVNQQNNTIMIGNGNLVQQYNTSWVTATLPQLTIPSGLEVTGIAYNRNLSGICTWNAKGREAYFFIWDAGATSANYAYPMGSTRAYFVAPYKDTFVILTSSGQLLMWTPSGLEQLGALPSFYTSALVGDVNDRADVAHMTSYYVDGDVFLFNLDAKLSQRGSEQTEYLQPSGMWCYDPAIGLYHRHAVSGAKVIWATIATANVATDTDIITVSGITVPQTGTPVFYASNGGIPSLAGLTNTTLYYTIKVSDTTLKLASTRANALAGTAVDLTGTGHPAQTLQFLPESDFGQLSELRHAGAITATGDFKQYQLSSSYVFGALDVPTTKVSTYKDSLCVTSRFGENRGYFVTQKMFSPNVTDHWTKLYIKARGLKTGDDKVIVKYRSTEDVNMPVYPFANNTNVGCTWVDATSFTTTRNLSNVQVGYEVEFIAGAGSGYLAHIIDISETGGTYTVTIDESIRNISANDTCLAVFDNWLKLGEEITYNSNKDYTEFSIGKQSKWIQLKIELRGRGVGIEEYELVNSTNKKAV